MAAFSAYILGLLFAGDAVAFRVQGVKPIQTVDEGSPLRLSCSSNSYYEYCTWRHETSVCEFEWKRKSYGVKKMRCSKRYDHRISFVGNYNGHECAVEIRDASASDAGVWRCEMESYQWGAVRGQTAKAKTKVKVRPRNQRPVPRSSSPFFFATMQRINPVRLTLVPDRRTND